jgi:endonuclease YncB( thermonuclease family)
MRSHLGRDRFPGEIRRFADGDTVIVLIEVGWGVHVEKYVRLVNLDSWELDEEDAIKAVAARDILDCWWGRKPCVLIPSTRGFDRYGRIRGHVQVQGHDLAKWIVDNKLGWWHGDPPQKQHPLAIVPQPAPLRTK